MGASGFARGQQARQAGFQATLEFGFDLRHEVVDHILQNQLRCGAQLAIEVLQVAGAVVQARLQAFAYRAEPAALPVSPGRPAWRGTAEAGRAGR